MTTSILTYRMYKYRLYRCDKKDRQLRHKLFVASTLWNHLIALHRRYYRLTGRYVPYERMSRYVLKLRKSRRFALWRDLHSQACQNVCRRVDDAYQRFFSKLAKHPPKFRPARKYLSFTFPQSGYQLVKHNHNQLKTNGKFTRVCSRIRIDGTEYRFVQHRPIQGRIKTLTIKRDSVGRLWLVFAVHETLTIEETSTGKSGGFDFGLKTFLTNDEGKAYISPQFFAQGMHRTRLLHRQLSRKCNGSKRRQRARRRLAKHSIDIANRRQDYHFKLAHELCDAYDVLYFEDLNLAAMKRLWGRKVSDLGFAQFMTSLKWVALKRGKMVVKIGRFATTTQKCSGCGKRHTLGLKDRKLNCVCGLSLDRDHNAAINIKTIGASMGYRSADQTRTSLRRRDEGRRPRL